MSDARSGWDRYWDGLQNDQRIFQHEADDLVERLRPMLAPLSHGRVLDFGSGFGFVAERLAPHVGELWLWDQSPSMREKAAARVARHPNARVAPSAPPGGTPGAFDLILVNSVAQYLTPAQLAACLTTWAGMLAPTGRVILADLIPPDYAATGDMLRLLRFAARRGFFWNALGAGAGEFVRYLRMRTELPLTRFGRTDIETLARAAGLVAEFPAANLGYKAGRLTAILRHDPAGRGALAGEGRPG
jgi:SAM-dependent methyltransferase